MLLVPDGVSYPGLLKRMETALDNDICICPSLLNEQCVRPCRVKLRLHLRGLQGHREELRCITSLSSRPSTILTCPKTRNHRLVIAFVRSKRKPKWLMFVGSGRQSHFLTNDFGYIVSRGHGAQRDLRTNLQGHLETTKLISKIHLFAMSVVKGLETRSNRCLSY